MTTCGCARWSVISARYEQGNIPSDIQRVMAQAMGGVQPTEQNQGTYDKVVTRLDNPIAADTKIDAAVASSAQDLPKRVYIQIYQESQRRKSKLCCAKRNLWRQGSKT